MNFKNKNILITGGSKGIGRKTAEIFLSLGAKVTITYRKDDNTVKSLKKMGINCIKLDSLADSYTKNLSKFLAKNKKLDILINNVGDAVKRTAFEVSDIQTWRKSFELNFFTTITTTFLALPYLKKSASGNIINISSIAAATTGAGDSLHYGVAKAAINSFTHGLAKELGQYNIRVNAVAPSIIDTDFQSRHSSKDRISKIISQTPLGKIGNVDEVAWPIIFLCSSYSSYISGECLYIDGGR